MLFTGEGKANAMSFGGENNKQQAAEDTNGDRQHNQELPCFIGRCWIQTVDNILIEQSNSYEHQERSDGMKEVNEAKPVLSSLFFGKGD